MQVDMILLSTHTPAFADLDRNGAADDVTGRQVLRIGSVAFHEMLAFGIR